MTFILVRSRARDNVGGTLVQQFQPDRAAEFARPIRSTLPRDFDEAVAGFIEHGIDTHSLPELTDSDLKTLGVHLLVH